MNDASSQPEAVKRSDADAPQAPRWFQYRLVALLHLTVAVAAVLGTGRVVGIGAALWMAFFYGFFVMVIHGRTSRQPKPTRAMAFGQVALCASAIWLSPLLLAVPVPYPLPNALFALICAYFLARRRYRSLAALLVLSPLGATFLLGAAHYCLGIAKLRSMGYPSATGNNLDPEIRCGRSTGGCVVHGDEWMYLGPHNAAVRAMSTLFGPMPGTYTGPYPTESQAIAIAAEGAPVSPQELIEDRVTIAGRVCHLDKGVGQRLLRNVRFHYLLHPQDRPAGSTPEPIRAALFEEECIILRIPAEPMFGEHENSAMIVLLSRSRGRPFAYYAEGERPYVFPPVGWWPD
jgi:hypothetical protein